jgi:hypothetical protein
LFVGQTLRLGDDGQVKLLIGHTHKTLKGGENYTIPYVRGAQDSEIMKALKYFSESAGRSASTFDERDAGMIGKAPIQGPELSSEQKKAVEEPIEKRKKLDHELAVWDSEPDLVLRHIFRAYVFGKYEMFDQVADEYEEALRIEPRSRSLSNAAMWAREIEKREHQ